MSYLFKYIRPFIDDEEGQGAVEYALMLVLVALVIAAANPNIGDQIRLVFQTMATKLTLPA